MEAQDNELINTPNTHYDAMAVKDDILNVMKKKGKPMSPGEVEKEVGADKKEFDKAFKDLKTEGAIVSPVRCKWEPAKK
jgi:hypothetical protein